MKKILFVTFLPLIVLLLSCGERIPTALSSPDGAIKVETLLSGGELSYRVVRKGETIVNYSKLGLMLKDGNLAENLTITSSATSAFEEQWEQVWGQEELVLNKYNELRIDLQQEESEREFSVVFRVFDDGVGFRYEFPEQENLQQFVIVDELTEFAFDDNHNSWSIPTHGVRYYEALYRELPIEKLDTVSTPLTMETKKGTHITLHEANLTDYAGLNLALKEGTTTLKADLTPWSTGEKVFVTTTRVSPWRVIIVGDNAGDLLLSRLILNLNEPCQIEDTSWIKPARYIGIWWAIHMEKYSWKPSPKHGATTANTKRYIDFAAEYNFPGVLVEGWNLGWEYDWENGGERFSFTQAYPDFDLAEITKYAAKNNVKLVGHHETGGATKNYEAQMEDAFKLYQNMGVDVVKTGYVSPLLDGKEHHSSQYGVRHFRKVVERAAEYNIMIDNHEPAMPSGLRRTFPNLMTQEGVRGQEYDAWSQDGGNPPNHTTIIPFTRGLAGPMDFTPGTFCFENPVFPQTRVQTTVAKQLALSVIIYSPLQMASDMIENYEGKAEFEFITSCPADWSLTAVPDAKIGEYVTIARKDRESENWYLGSITNEESRDMSLKLDFLEKGATYKAKIFRDGEGADYKTNPYPVEITEQEVTSDTVLDVHLATSGGVAIIFTKI